MPKLQKAKLRAVLKAVKTFQDAVQNLEGEDFDWWSDQCWEYWFSGNAPWDLVLEDMTSKLACRIIGDDHPSPFMKIN